MARLPIPGKDSGTWGQILNDYLSQSHNTDGTLKTDSVTATQIQDGTITESQLDSATQTKINTIAPVTSVSSKTGDVTLTKSDVGLSSVDNTSDADKPVSTAQQAAIDAGQTWPAITAKDAGSPLSGDSVRLRRGTAAQWVSANPVLASGEEGIETDTSRKKRGDGVTPWNSLPYGDRAYQREMERTYRRKPLRFELPAGFGWDPGVPILTDGLSYWTTYDAETRKNTGGTTIYWNSATGDNSTGDGSSGAPYKSFSVCYAAASDGDTIILQNSGVTWRNNGPVTTEITKDINVIAANPGETTYAVADLLSWSATPGRTGVYEASRTNVRKVVDIELDDDGLTYTRAADLDECESTPMSWYQASNGTGSVYVHNYDGTSPNPTTVLALLSSHVFNLDGTTRSGAQNFYMEGIRIIGSNTGMEVYSDSSDVLTFTAKNCEFLHMGYGGVGASTQGDLFNAVNVLGNVNFLAQGVRAAYASLDGFNYHENSPHLPSFVEINCIAHDCGREPESMEVGVNPTMNGSTAHDGIKGIRIGGKYHHTYGGMVTDVQSGTKTVNLSCDAWASLASVGSGYSRAFAVGQPSDPNAEMWLYGCRAWGCYRDIYADSGTTMHVFNTEFITKDGGGTFDITTTA